MEFLKADYTEVWISSPAVPLVQFADRVRSVAATRLDAVLDSISKELTGQLCAFDEIVSWYGTNRPEFRAVLESVHPRCTFLAALPGESCRMHATDFFLQQVGAPTGQIPSIKVHGDEPRQAVVIHPFSGSIGKNWPLEKFKELAARLPQVEWAQTGFEDLLDLARWMKGALAYLGNDSGISHLAAAIGMRVVALFGPTNPEVWAPRGSNVTIVQHQPLSELPVDRVLQTLIGG